MRNLPRAVFDKTFKAGDKFAEPDRDVGRHLHVLTATVITSWTEIVNLTLSADIWARSRRLVDNVEVIHRYNGQPIDRFRRTSS